MPRPASGYSPNNPMLDLYLGLGSPNQNTNTVDLQAFQEQVIAKEVQNQSGEQKSKEDNGGEDEEGKGEGKG